MRPLLKPALQDELEHGRALLAELRELPFLPLLCECGRLGRSLSEAHGPGTGEVAIRRSPCSAG